MTQKSELKALPFVLKNRRPAKSRMFCVERVKPADINYGKVRQTVKLRTAAGMLLKDVNLEAVLAKHNSKSVK